MSSKIAKEGLTSRFKQLSQYAFFSNPHGKVGVANQIQPSLVLFFGSMDASHRLMQKYAFPLRDLFPAATMVIITSDTPCMWTSQGQMEKHLAPVIDIIKKELAANSTYRGTYCHVMSNGGGFQLVALRKLLMKFHISDFVQPPAKKVPAALVLDSTPGDHGLRSAMIFLSPSQPILHAAAKPVIAGLYALYALNLLIRGNPPVFDELRSTLNMPDILPYLTDATPSSVSRLYLYSDADGLVPCRTVERHIEEAISKGFDVMEEKFSGPAHIALARDDPVKYWEAVAKVWAHAVEVSGVNI